MGPELRFDFAKPSVATVSENAQALATEGGTEVVFKGRNFGPEGAEQGVSYENQRG